MYYEDYNQEEKGYRIKNANDILAMVKKFDWYYLNNSEYVTQNEDLDVIQCRVKNEVKQLLDRGLIPLDEDEIDFVFSSQEKFNI